MSNTTFSSSGSLFGERIGSSATSIPAAPSNQFSASGSFGGRFGSSSASVIPAAPSNQFSASGSFGGGTFGSSASVIPAVPLDQISIYVTPDVDALVTPSMMFQIVNWSCKTAPTPGQCPFISYNTVSSLQNPTGINTILITAPGQGEISNNTKSANLKLVIKNNLPNNVSSSTELYFLVNTSLDEPSILNFLYSNVPTLNGIF